MVENPKNKDLLHKVVFITQKLWRKSVKTNIYNGFQIILPLSFGLFIVFKILAQNLPCDGNAPRLPLDITWVLDHE